MVLVVYARLRNGRPVFVGGQDHTYHRLHALGLDATRSVLAMQLCGILLGLVAFVLLDFPVLIANAVFAAVAVGGVVLIYLLERQILLASPGASDRERGDFHRGEGA